MSLERDTGIWESVVGVLRLIYLPYHSESLSTACFTDHKIEVLPSSPQWALHIS